LMQRGKGLGFSFSIVPLSSAIQVLDVWRTGSKAGKHVTWRFLDSYKLIPTGLDKALKSFGIGAKLEHDLAIHENDPSWLDYNRGDCEQLWKLVNRFHRYVEDTLGGEIGITAPSTAMKLYRRKYLTASIPRSRWRSRSRSASRSWSGRSATGGCSSIRAACCSRSSPAMPRPAPPSCR
jgi:hypothetical protein